MRISSKLAFAGAAVVFAAAAQGQWSDNFDSYAANISLQGVGGWVGWDNVAGAAGFVSAAQSRSAPHSQRINGPADSVHTYAVDSGQWVYTAYMYIPTGATGTTYFIINNIYNHNGPYNWSVQIPFNLGTNAIVDDLRAETAGPLTVVRDRWVEISIAIDLDADSCTTTYDGVELSTGTWTTGPASITSIGAVDLYANNAAAVYFDDLSLQMALPPCPADYDGDGFVTGLDFDAFVADFEAGDPMADFDGDGFITGLDFDAYVLAFEAGC